MSEPGSLRKRLGVPTVDLRCRGRASVMGMGRLFSVVLSFMLCNNILSCPFLKPQLLKLFYVPLQISVIGIQPSEWYGEWKGVLTSTGMTERG